MILVCCEQADDPVRDAAEEAHLWSKIDGAIINGRYRYRFTIFSVHRRGQSEQSRLVAPAPFMARE